MGIKSGLIGLNPDDFNETIILNRDQEEIKRGTSTEMYHYLRDLSRLTRARMYVRDAENKAAMEPYAASEWFEGAKEKAVGLLLWDLISGGGPDEEWFNRIVSAIAKVL